MTTDTVHIGEEVGYIFTGYGHLTTAEVSCSLCACGQITGSELNKEDSYPLSKCGLVAANYLLCAFFLVIPRRLNSIRQSFGTVCRDLPTYEDGKDSVPKRWHTKFRSRGITQNKAYNIQNMAKD
jgi:hypothetical protein